MSVYPVADWWIAMTLDVLDLPLTSATLQEGIQSTR